VNEEVACQQYLLNYLGSDTTLSGLVRGVWLRSVPENEPLPAVKIDRQEASDVNAVNLYRVWSDMLFLIRGVVHWRGTGAVDWTEVQAIGDRLDALLHKYEGQSSTLYVHAFREEPWTDETLEGGDLFLHAGGMYRVRAKAL
jgi:hypothetical protein